MKWKLIAHGMAILSRMPGGHRLYHRLQTVLGTNRMDVDEGLRRSIEVIDLRSIVPLDFDTIARSVRKTHRLLTKGACGHSEGLARR